MYLYFDTTQKWCLSKLWENSIESSCVLTRLYIDVVNILNVTPIKIALRGGHVCKHVIHKCVTLRFPERSRNPIRLWQSRRLLDENCLISPSWMDSSGCVGAAVSEKSLFFMLPPKNIKRESLLWFLCDESKEREFRCHSFCLSRHYAFRLTEAPSSLQQGEQHPLEKMKHSRSRNLEEALSETDTLVRVFFYVCV